MPLLDIIDISSFNAYFYSCFAFLEEEEERLYLGLKMFGKVLGVNFETIVIIFDKELALINAIKVIFLRTIRLCLKLFYNFFLLCENKFFF